MFSTIKVLFVCRMKACREHFHTSLSVIWIVYCYSKKSKYNTNKDFLKTNAMISTMHQQEFISAQYLKGSWDCDDFHNCSWESFNVIFPVQNISNVKICDGWILQPATQIMVFHWWFCLEDGKWNSSEEHDGKSISWKLEYVIIYRT